jgi:hypothetical protein
MILRPSLASLVGAPAEPGASPVTAALDDVRRAEQAAAAARVRRDRLREEYRSADEEMRDRIQHVYRVHENYLAVLRTARNHETPEQENAR